MSELDGLTKAYLKQINSEKGRNMSSYSINDRLASPLGLVAFYKNQLRKFSKIGLGNKTEFHVTVTPELIKVTIKRLEELYKNKIGTVSK